MVQTELYLLEPIHFLRTCTIKSDYLAWMSRNNDLRPEFQESLPDELLPYYRHMRGEYILKDGYTEVYGVDTPNYRIYTKFDTMMEVNSWDNKKVISFTKDELIKHPKTAEWYRIPNAQFFKLCTKYPTQSDLIKSILYPIPDDTDAVNAENFSLLQYDLELLEENERISIISAIRTFLESVRVRWDVKEFCFEHMYPVAFQDILWNQLYNCIFTQRILNIKTSNVHSYHVWEYLKSNGFGDYRDVLSINKALFLYRNTEYILQNQGTRKNFSILIGSLLSDMNIDIQQKAIVQGTMDVNIDESEDSGNIATNTKLQGNNSVQDTCSPSVKILSFPTGEDTYINQARSFMTGSVKSTARRYATTGTSSSIGASGSSSSGSIGTGSTGSYNKLNTGNFTTAVLSIQNETTNNTNLDLTKNGTYETTTSLYNKERQAGLEYQDDALFEASCKQQEASFPATPHTLLLSKVHELNTDTGSDLIVNLYAEYISQSLLYRSSLGHMNFSVHVDNSDDVDVWLLNGDEALALMLYCSMRSIGVHLEIPLKSVFLNIAYLTEFPEVPETFKYNNMTFKTSQYLTAYGFKDMVAHPNPFNDLSDVERVLNEEAENYVNNYIQLHTKPTGKGVEIFADVFKGRMTYGYYNLDLLQGRTYQEYFDDRPEIEQVILKYNSYDDPRSSYDELFLTIIKSVFENIENTELAKGVMSTSTIARLKELFISLCSYNISFVDGSAATDIVSLPLPRISNEFEIASLSTLEKDHRYVPNTYFSYNMDDLYHDSLYGDQFILRFNDGIYQQDLYTGTAEITPNYLNTTNIWEFVPVQARQLVYRVDNFGLIYGDNLIRLINSLLYNDIPFYTNKNANEYKFLKFKLCLFDREDKVIINEENRTLLTQMKDYFETEAANLMKAIAGTPSMTHNSIQSTTSEIYPYVDNTSGITDTLTYTQEADEVDWEASYFKVNYFIEVDEDLIEIESVNFIGYADTLEGLDTTDGNLVYLNKYNNSDNDIRIGFTRYICYNGTWYVPIIENEKSATIEKE